jgi:PKD repeat protein
MGNVRRRLPYILTAVALTLLVLPGCQLLLGGTSSTTKPTADAGFDQTDVAVNTTVTLDGSASIGSGLKYKWALSKAPQGASQTILNSTKDVATYKPTVAGDYTFRLTVTNSSGGTDTADVLIFVVGSSTTGGSTDGSIVAKAGADQADVSTNSDVILNGSSSTGIGLSYAWTITASPAGASQTITNDTTANASYKPTIAGSYTFKLTVTDTAAKTSSDEMIVTVKAAVVAKGPLPPLGLSLGGATPTTIDLSWSPVDLATSYQVFKDTLSSGTFADKVYDGPNTQVTADTLTAGTIYYFKIAASNAAGDRGDLSPAKTLKTLATGATGGLKSPTVLTFSNQTTQSIDISWAAIKGATKYYLYRDDLATGDFVNQVYTGTSLTATDADTLVLGTDYFYKIKAQAATGSSALSKSFKASTLDQDLAPKAPSGLIVGGASDKSLTVTWDPAATATKYFVYRLEDKTGKINSSTDYELVTAAGVTETSYTDTGLSSMATFHYKVTAGNDIGESPMPKINKSATTLAAGQALAPTQVSWATTPITAIGSTTLTLNWVAVTEATAYVIYRETSATGSFTTALKTTADAKATTYSDTSVSASTQYFYKVAAKNATGEGLLSSSKSATTTEAVLAPTAPAAPKPADIATAIDPSLDTSFSWTASFDAGATAANPLGYDFYLGTSSSSLVKQNAKGLAELSFTVFKDTFASSTTYYWKVVANNPASGLASSDSAVWSFTTKAAATGSVLPPSITAAFASSDSTGKLAVSQSVKNVAVYLNVSASDSNTPLTYSWTVTSGPTTTGITNGTTSSATFTPASTGDYSIKVVVTNSKGKTANSTIALKIIDGGSFNYGIQ